MSTFDSVSPALQLEAGRYRLVVSAHCPFCRRVTIVWRLLGLREAIGLSVFDAKGGDGFEYVERDENLFDPVLRVRSTRELYRRQDDWERGQSTAIPVVVDLQSRAQIALRESELILRELVERWGNTEMARPLEFAPGVPYVLWPESERSRAAECDAWVDERLVPVVGQIVHAQDTVQTFTLLSDALTGLEERLREHEFLLGAQPRLSDVRAFATLGTLYRANPYVLSGFGNLRAWFERLWALPGWVDAREREVLDPRNLLR